MDHQHRSPSPPDPDFAALAERYQPAALHYARRLVRQSQFLGPPDEDDIYALGMAKLWRAYFRPGARQQYRYCGGKAEFGLIKAALRSVAHDLNEQRQRESASLRPVEVDTPDSDDLAQDNWGQTADFTEAIILKVDLERFMSQQLAGSTLWWVALYVSGHLSREQLAHYSDGNLRVGEFRLKQQVIDFLRR